MKRIFTTLLALVAFVAMVTAQTVVESKRPSNKAFQKAVATIMYKTNGHDITAKRMKAMEVTQSELNHFPHTEWRAYRNIKDTDALAEAELSSVPYFMRQALDKIKKEVETTKVKDGTVAIWLLYNMGYIIKTPTAVFGIDIHTRYVEEVADLVDFTMVTHAHGDHTNKPFLKAMSARGKQVFAAFDIEGVNSTKIEHEAVYTVGDITIRTTIGDHNRKLRNYVTSYEIDCGPRTDNTVLFHTGDSNNYLQLNPEKKVDIFMLHMSVGLNIQAAINNIQPRHVFLSHLQELGHRIDKWRWTFHDALKLKDKLNHNHIWIPCWGERIIYKRSNWK